MENVLNVFLTDDQHFLLYHIIGAYFGPDLKEGWPRKSSLQRLVEALPQYHADDLAGSHMQTNVIENVYYYALRNADQSVVVQKPVLLQYILGSFPLTFRGAATYLQFDDLFPPNLHQRSQSENQCFTIANTAFINNPEMNYIKPGDIERLKRLTGLQDFVFNRESTHIIMDGVFYNPKELHSSRLYDTLQHLNTKPLHYAPCTDTYPDGSHPPNSSNPFGSSLCNGSQVLHSSIVTSPMTTRSDEGIDQGMLFLPSCPSKEEWSNLAAAVNCGFALTGSAARGHVGPGLGLMDIGESEDSYLFRVSLPGVRRDQRDFSCEVESDGTVIIKGITVTGEKRVEKYCQVFEMLSQNLCPPGPFSISFKLPGPVDPQQFHGTFATDGILEGIAWKARRYKS